MNHLKPIVKTVKTFQEYKKKLSQNNKILSNFVRYRNDNSVLGVSPVNKQMRDFIQCINKI